MNSMISVDSLTFAVIILMLVILGIGFCFLLLLLQSLSDKNRWLRQRNESLKEQLSDKEFELYLTKNGLQKE